MHQMYLLLKSNLPSIYNVPLTECIIFTLHLHVALKGIKLYLIQIKIYTNLK